MAADWIKMRAALVKDPKVIAITRALQKDNDFRHWLTPGGGAAVNGQIVSTPALRCVTAALLMCVWSIARTHGRFVAEDLILPHSELQDIDEMAGAPGIAREMMAVGWVVELPEGGLKLPNFKEFNVPMTAAEKQSGYRKRQKGVTDALPTDGNGKRKNVTTREEERRGEHSSSDSSSHTAAPDVPTTPADQVGVFEGQSPQAFPGATPVGIAAAALNRAGIRITSLNPDLIAAISEGVTASNVIELREIHPDKPAGYLIAAARRMRAAPALPVVATTASPHAIGKTMTGINALEGLKRGKPVAPERNSGGAAEAPVLQLGTNTGG